MQVEGPQIQPVPVQPSAYRVQPIRVGVAAFPSLDEPSQEHSGQPTPAHAQPLHGRQVTHVSSVGQQPHVHVGVLQQPVNVVETSSDDHVPMKEMVYGVHVDVHVHVVMVYGVHVRANVQEMVYDDRVHDDVRAEPVRNGSVQVSEEDGSSSTLPSSWQA